MESKPKACCANCEWCDKNGYKCKRSGAFVEKWIFCTYYHGNGITPEQEIEQAKKRIAELEAENKTLNSHALEMQTALIVIADEPEEYFAENGLSYAKYAAGVLEKLKKQGMKPASAPVAKPIVWEELERDSAGYEDWHGRVGRFKFIITKSPLTELFNVRVKKSDKSDEIFEIIARGLTSIEAAKQFAQDWLNKLVAQCAVGGRTIPQFTENEIRIIRRLAKDYVGEFSQAYPMQPIVALAAKCDAMLKGVQR